MSCPCFHSLVYNYVPDVSDLCSYSISSPLTIIVCLNPTVENVYSISFMTRLRKKKKKKKKLKVGILCEKTKKKQPNHSNEIPHQREAKGGGLLGNPFSSSPFITTLFISNVSLSPLACSSPISVQPPLGLSLGPSNPLSCPLAFIPHFALLL